MPVKTMRAIRFRDYGLADQLMLDEVARPEPREGQVLVRVHAAGVNPIDWKIRMGYLRDVMPVPLPFTPGFDLAGVVESVGPGVTAVAPGQAVFGRGMGAYADYALAPTGSLAPQPASLTFDQAATIPTGATTAWAALFDLADLKAGQTILIHGAAGGVGLFAVQFARERGARVIGTASGANLDFVRSLGAETVIDYTTTRFETVVHRADVVLDTVGGETQHRSWQMLKPGGILVELAGPVSAETARKHGVRAGNPVVQVTTELLGHVAALFEAGKLVTVVQKVFPLVEARQAQELSEMGHGRGRIVLHVTE